MVSASHRQQRELLRAVADDIDHLISIDLNRRGVIKNLFAAARRKTRQPLVLRAAECLHDHCAQGTVVLIATGWPDRPWISPAIGELDGPPGAALLARAVHRMLGVVPLFLIEDQLQPAMRATARAAGFSCLEPEQALAACDSPAPIRAASVLPFPTERARAKTEATRLVSTFQPAVMIAVEKGSENRKGIIHNARGQDTTEHMAKVDELVRVCRDRGIPTIGITIVREYTEKVKPPRSIFLKWSLGHPLGEPFNVSQHRTVLKKAFEALLQIQKPGDIIDVCIPGKKRLFVIH